MYYMCTTYILCSRVKTPMGNIIGRVVSVNATVNLAFICLVIALDLDLKVMRTQLF